MAQHSIRSPGILTVFVGKLEGPDRWVASAEQFVEDAAHDEWPAILITFDWQHLQGRA